MNNSEKNELVHSPFDIPVSTTLEGSHVVLRPLTRDYFDELTTVAADKRIWQHYSVDGWKSDIIQRELESALVERDRATQFPFVIELKETGSIIGSTRLLEIVAKHRKVEIGWTWLKPDYWGTIINIECKLLLLRFCFEQLGTLRVTLRTDENNTRSRKAIEKIGAQFEGVLRCDILRDNGTNRHSAYYSIIHTEWSHVHQALQERFEKMNSEKQG